MWMSVATLSSCASTGVWTHPGPSRVCAHRATMCSRTKGAAKVMEELPEIKSSVFLLVKVVKALEVQQMCEQWVYGMVLLVKLHLTIFWWQETFFLRIPVITNQILFTIKYKTAPTQISIFTQKWDGRNAFYDTFRSGHIPTFVIFWYFWISISIKTLKT